MMIDLYSVDFFYCLVDLALLGQIKWYRWFLDYLWVNPVRLLQTVKVHVLVCPSDVSGTDIDSSKA